MLVWKERFLTQIGTPQVLVLLLGTNDLIQNCRREPEFFLDQGVQRIILVESLPRYGGAVMKGKASKFACETGLTTMEDLEIEFCMRRVKFNRRLIWLDIESST